MQRLEALEQATKIAMLILRESRNVTRTTLGNQSLMGHLSFMVATKDRDFEAATGEIVEIVLFGSVASSDNDTHVGDIDLMVFDKGFYSNILGVEHAERRSTRGSGGFRLRNTLRDLFTGWFSFSENDPEIEAVFKGQPVDLHVLPIQMFIDQDRRRKIAASHHDPKFFENAFASMMRLDQAIGQFVPVDITYFEQVLPTIMEERALSI